MVAAPGSAEIFDGEVAVAATWGVAGGVDPARLAGEAPPWVGEIDFARRHFVATVYLEAADPLTVERVGVRGGEQLSGDGLEFGAVVVEMWGGWRVPRSRRVLSPGAR
ncbi:hypothetical protein ACFVX3_32845 [Rhodococcus erythropolis]